jgi:hypothetical protein
METIPNPGRNPADAPGNPDYPGEDVREPPLPGEGGERISPVRTI